MLVVCGILFTFSKIISATSTCMCRVKANKVKQNECLFFLPVTFLFPRRPNLGRINSIGHRWIYLSWNRNNRRDNVTNYQVKYSYIGECPGVVRRIMMQRLNGSTISFNITGLEEYSNYSINLTAINNTGISPPNIAFSLTGPAGSYI